LEVKVTNSLKLGFLLEKSRDISPILRRFLINTLFDSTFMQLGIIMGSAFAAGADLRLTIGTLVASSVALGISTGVSVYESETLEREKKMIELEKALFRKLDNTMIAENFKSYARILAVVNFFTPLLCCAIVSIPLLFATLKLVDGTTASWVSVISALSILFITGTYLGRLGKQNPLVKGLRMVVFGVIAFIIGFLIQTWI